MGSTGRVRGNTLSKFTDVSFTATFEEFNGAWDRWTRGGGLLSAKFMSSTRSFSSMLTSLSSKNINYGILFIIPTLYIALRDMGFAINTISTKVPMSAIFSTSKTSLTRFPPRCSAWSLTSRVRCAMLLIMLSVSLRQRRFMWLVKLWGSISRILFALRSSSTSCTSVSRNSIRWMLLLVARRRLRCGSFAKWSPWRSWSELNDTSRICKFWSPAKPLNYS